MKQSTCDRCKRTVFETRLHRKKIQLVHSPHRQFGIHVRNGYAWPKGESYVRHSDVCRAAD